MNIAFFTDTYLPNTDGVVISILSLKEEMEKKGHKVYIYCPGNKETKETNIDPFVHYHSSIRFPPYPDYRVAVFPFFSISRLRDAKIDIIHSHALATMGISAYITANKLKIPCIATYHTKVSDGVHYISKHEQVQKTGKKVVWDYCRWFYKNFNTVTCPSKYIQKTLEEEQINAEVYPNGIPIKRFIKTKPSKKIIDKLKSKDKEVILCLGRVVKEKNYGLVIKSMPEIIKEIPNVLLIIVGGGPALEHYKQMVKEYKLEKYVNFTGFIPNEKLPEIYSIAKTLAFPSTFETQGLVGLEAMACGCPVTGIINSAITEMITEGKTGYLFSNNTISCKNAIIKTINEYKTLSKNTRKTALQYSKEKIANSFIELYDKLISEHKINL